MTVALNTRPEVKRIDPHVHFRDWSEWPKSTIRGGMDLAKSQGIVAVADMANTKLKLQDAQTLFSFIGDHLSKQTMDIITTQLEHHGGSIISRELVELRLKTAELEGVTSGYYLHIGITNKAWQIIEAAEVATENPKVVGMKIVYGTTTNDLSIIEESDIKKVFDVLTGVGYDGLVVVHCEKEQFGNSKVWNPKKPYTWNLAKPQEMETEAIEDIIRIAGEKGFNGHIHIAHISTHEGVMLVNKAKGYGMKISCGATPHHFIYSTEDMQTAYGIKLKVNPPIREEREPLLLMEHLRKGNIDCIETDHAPHTLYEKTYDPNRDPKSYMSGIRSLEGYAAFLESLKSDHGLPEKQINDLTYSNVKKIFTKIRE